MHWGRHGPEDSPEGRPLEGQTVGGAPIFRGTGQLWDTLCLRPGEARGADQTSQKGTLVLTARSGCGSHNPSVHPFSLGHRDNKRTHLIGMLGSHVHLSQWLGPASREPMDRVGGATVAVEAPAGVDRSSGWEP